MEETRKYNQRKMAIPRISSSEKGGLWPVSSRAYVKTTAVSSINMGGFSEPSA